MQEENVIKEDDEEMPVMNAAMPSDLITQVVYDSFIENYKPWKKNTRFKK